MALSSAQGEGGHLGPTDDAGAPSNHPAEPQPAFDGPQDTAPAAAESAADGFKILSQPAEGKVMDNGDGTFSFDTGGDFQDLPVGEIRQVSFKFLLERSEVVTATVTVSATPDGPVAEDVSYVSEGDEAAAPRVNELDQAPSDVTGDGTSAPASFDADPMTDLGELELAEPISPELEAPAAQEPAMPAPVASGPGESADQDSAGFGAEPIMPLADLDFAAAPSAAHAAAFESSMRETGGNHPRDTLDAGAPAFEEPAASEPSFTEPLAMEPAASEPAFTEPLATEPAASEPAFTEPLAMEPAASEPSFTEPLAMEPAASEPTFTEPVDMEPAAIEPVASEPSATEPLAIEPLDSDLTFTEPAPVEPPASELILTEPAAEEAVAESEIEILSQPEVGIVGNNGDGTFSFDPGDAFQDLADGQTRDVSFLMRLADGAVMTAVITVVGDPAGPLARDVNFLAQDDAPAAAEPALDMPADPAPDIEEPGFEASGFESPGFEASPVDEPSFGQPAAEEPAQVMQDAPTALAAPPSPFDAFGAFDKPSAPAADSGHAADLEPISAPMEPDLPSVEPTAPTTIERAFDSTPSSFEPTGQEPASDDLFASGLDSPFDQVPSAPDPSGHQPFDQEVEAPMAAFDSEPALATDPEPGLPGGSAESSSFGDNFAGFSDFGAGAAEETPAASSEPLDLMAEPAPDQEPALSSDAQAAPELTFGGREEPIADEQPTPAAMAPDSMAEPAFDTPATTGEEDFAGMDGARRVDTLQLSGVTAGPGTGGWNVELASGRIVDIQDGCVMLEAGSAGTLVLDDSNVRISFDGIERIVW